jgi:hypothetical protein
MNPRDHFPSNNFILGYDLQINFVHGLNFKLEGLEQRIFFTQSQHLRCSKKKKKSNKNIEICLWIPQLMCSKILQLWKNSRQCTGKTLILIFKYMEIPGIYHESKSHVVSAVYLSRKKKC